MITIFIYTKQKDQENGKNPDILKDILHILLILIGLKEEKISNPIVVHMKFYSGMLKVNKEIQVVHLHWEMKNGTHGLVL